MKNPKKNLEENMKSVKLQARQSDGGDVIISPYKTGARRLATDIYRQIDWARHTGKAQASPPRHEPGIRLDGEETLLARMALRVRHGQARAMDGCGWS